MEKDEIARKKREGKELVKKNLLRGEDTMLRFLHAVAKFNKILHDQIHISQKTAQQIRKDRLGFSVYSRGEVGEGRAKRDEG
jgi:hypothetical protein